MNHPPVAQPRPQRWDRAFGDDMTDELVARLLRVPPFADMDERAFPRATPLRGLLRNDTRVVRYEAGQLVFREGDYGDSAMLVLDGALRVALDRLAPQQLGRTGEKANGFLGGLLATIRGESRKRTQRPNQVDGVFLQDVPAVLDAKRTATLRPGELFGELSAMTRAPRSASVFAETPATLLEVRWQGLRDLMRHSPALKEHVDRLYRENSLRLHLRSTPLLTGLSDEALAAVADAVSFEAYGAYDWRDETDDDDPLTRARREPVVVEEGLPAEDLLLVRSGFARVSVRHGEGTRTLAYVGKGQAFGAEELAVGVVSGQPPAWRRSLTAVGYLDVIRVPAVTFVRHILPALPPKTVSEWVSAEARSVGPVGSVEARRLDYLVDRRLLNGTEAMVIDLDRCTRCDDCVRACAATHEGEPRFVRQGPTHDRFQITHACMHCVDPVCMIGCPTGAIHRDEATGVVRINDDTCVGCTTCAQSCPYDNIRMVEVRDGAGRDAGAIVFDEATGQPILRASKCDLCVDRRSGPACQDACPHDALVRLDLTDPQSLTEWGGR